MDSHAECSGMERGGTTVVAQSAVVLQSTLRRLTAMLQATPRVMQPSKNLVSVTEESAL